MGLHKALVAAFADPILRTKTMTDLLLLLWRTRNIPISERPSFILDFPASFDSLVADDCGKESSDPFADTNSISSPLLLPHQHVHLSAKHGNGRHVTDLHPLQLSFSRRRVLAEWLLPWRLHLNAFALRAPGGTETETTQRGNRQMAWLRNCQSILWTNDHLQQQQPNLGLVTICTYRVDQIGQEGNPANIIRSIGMDTVFVEFEQKRALLRR